MAYMYMYMYMSCELDYRAMSCECEHEAEDVMKLIPMLESPLKAVASLTCAAIVFAGDSPAMAAESRYLQQDVQAANDRVELSVSRYADLAHSIVEKARPEALQAYESSLLRLARSTDATELSKAVEQGIALADTVAPESLKQAWSGLDASTCTTVVPLPPSSAWEGLPLVEQWPSAWKALPRRDGGICLPSGEALEELALAQARAASTTRDEQVRAFQKQLRLALGSVQKGAAFKVFTEVRQAQEAVLSTATFAERDGFKKAGDELAKASAFADDLRRKQAEGPPKCFTIGCQANFDYDIWRYDSRDDYTGAGLEKPKSILKPI